MRIEHLTDDELDLALIGETPPAAAEHLDSCIACRRRRDAFVAAVEHDDGGDPDGATRESIREGALAAWSGAPARPHRARWLAAAAVVAALALLPLLRSEIAGRPKVDTDAVLTQVDEVLARDPLDSAAPPEVVKAVVPVPVTGEEGSWS